MRCLLPALHTIAMKFSPSHRHSRSLREEPRHRRSRKALSQTPRPPLLPWPPRTWGAHQAAAQRRPVPLPCLKSRRKARAGHAPPPVPRPGQRPTRKVRAGCTRPPQGCVTPRSSRPAWEYPPLLPQEAPPLLPLEALPLLPQEAPSLLLLLLLEALPLLPQEAPPLLPLGALLLLLLEALPLLQSRLLYRCLR